MLGLLDIFMRVVEIVFYVAVIAWVIKNWKSGDASD
jgi:type IV secretory pathway TrbL component